jgi:DNA helicase HerA-like ATPase
VFATTGMGKSNLMKVLAGQLLAAHGRYAMLLFDPHGEYLEGGVGRKGLVDHPWANERLRVYSPSPQAGQGNLLRLSLAELTPDDLKTSWKFSTAQGEALETAYAELGDKGTWLTRLAEESPEVLKDAELGRHALATIQVLSRRAQRIVRLQLMTDDPSQSLTGKVLDDLADGKVVLIDTSGLEAVEETLVASLLTRSLLNERASAYRTDRERFGQLPRTLVALEEAQRVLTRLDDAEFNVFPRLAREGRKFNVGLCAVTQQPKLIDSELLSQFNTYFVLGLADERDRNTLRSSSKQDLSDLSAEIQTLMPGEALVTNPEAPFALPARIHYYEEWLTTVPRPEPPRERPAEAMSGFYE